MTLLYRSGDRSVSSDKEVGEGLEGQMAGPWPLLVVGLSLGLFCRTEARGRSLFVCSNFLLPPSPWLLQVTEMETSQCPGVGHETVTKEWDIHTVKVGSQFPAISQRLN